MGFRVDLSKERQGSLLIIASISVIAIALQMMGREKEKELPSQFVPMSAITSNNFEDLEASASSPVQIFELMDSQKAATCKDVDVSPNIQMFQTAAATQKSPLSKKYVFSSVLTNDLSGKVAKENGFSYYWKVTPPRRSSIHPQIKRGNSLELYPDISGAYAIRLLVVKDRTICGHKDVKVDVYLPGSTPARPWQPMRSSKAYVLQAPYEPDQS